MAVRLFFDENLARRLVQGLSDVFPGSVHVEDVLGRGVTDECIWTHALEAGFLIVTKDEDFQRLSVLRGAPPKVVWVRLGNCSTAQVADLLRRNHDLVARFLRHDEATFLALG